MHWALFILIGIIIGWPIGFICSKWLLRAIVQSINDAIEGRGGTFFKNLFKSIIAELSRPSNSTEEDNPIAFFARVMGGINVETSETTVINKDRRKRSTRAASIPDEDSDDEPIKAITEKKEVIEVIDDEDGGRTIIKRREEIGKSSVVEDQEICSAAAAAMSVVDEHIKKDQ